MTANRVAVVTGGLTGIGLASALELQAAGVMVAVGSRVGSDSEAGHAARQILGDAAMIGALDVADQVSVDAFCAKVQHQLGPVDILVNAAGIYAEAVIDGHSDEAWSSQIDINLTGPFRMTRALLPDMMARGWGRIVNIASTAAHIGAAGYAGYCASKAGLLGLTRVTALEGAPHGVTCVSISPTWIDTPMMDRATARHAKAGGTSAKDAKQALETSNPQGRIVQPQEISSLVAFCCGDGSPALTGEDIQVTAGAIW
jgi:NAD(P)-dependent dehydrogenase (short-subunit alcohol dehydrogenase family)